MIKKLGSSIIFAILLMAICHQTVSAEEVKKIVVGVNDSLIDLDKKSGHITDNTAYLSIDSLLKGLRAEINYDERNMVMTANKNGKTIIFSLLDNKIKTSDGIIKTNLIKKINGSYFVPIRYIGEYFGFQVEYFQKHKMVRIYNENHSYSHDTFVQNYRSEIEKYFAREYEKVVYLTFDDGPNHYTSQILDILKKKDAKGTFFMLEGNIKSFPQVVKRMVKEGNYPGLHSVSHNVSKLYKGNPQNVAAEMEKTGRTLLEVAGVNSKLTRVPFGSKPYMTKPFRDHMAKKGFKMWDWTIDTEDWRYKLTESKKIVTSVKNGITKLEKEKKPIVILLHDSKTTVSVLSEIIDYVRLKGYEPISYNPSEHEIVNFWTDLRL